MSSLPSPFGEGSPIAVTLGDPAGIGPEIVAKAWQRREAERLPCFFALGTATALAAVWRGPIERIADPAAARAVFGRALPLIALPDGDPVLPGQPDLAGARVAFDALEAATGLARSGAARALVTAPVSKTQLQAVGFRHPGQTEFVAERCGVSPGKVVMLLAGPTLRVVPLTTHVALADVPGALTVELIVDKAVATDKGLRRDFGIARPRLAFAGVNPHAGENGALGREEIELIAPAIERLRALGLDVSGPHAADAMFHARARSGYDVAMCAYHDQALIPLKTLHFDEGVNMTLGLPIVRTSPDHGTAFDIAGRDRAEPGAMITAIRMAAASADMRAA